MGVQLNRSLSFGELLQNATNKAIQSGANLARLMPTFGGSTEAEKRLVESVVHSKLLDEAPVWASVPPIDILAKEKEVFLPCEEHTCVNNEQENARVKEAIRKDARRKLDERWNDEQTGR